MKLSKEIRDIIIIVAVLVFIRSSFINWYQIPTGSMQPSLKIGDHVMINKLAYGFMIPFMHTRAFSWDTPERGEVVVFRDKHERTFWGVFFPKNLIKRVVGVGGDRISFSRGVLTVNNVPLHEELVLDHSILADINPEDRAEFQGRNLYMESGASKTPHYIIRDEFGGRTNTEIRTWVIPQGKLLVIGDNRDGSDDGRYWGFVDEKDIYGRAFIISFSIKSWGDFPKIFRSERWFMPITQ